MRSTRSSRSAWAIASTDLPDPFAVNPIRRAFGLVSVSGTIVFGPILYGEPAATVVMLSIGWLAATGLVMGIPILLLSLGEEGWRRFRRFREPSVLQLELSPRVAHVLLRHGYESIRVVERAPDESLLLLSNMDARGLREVRRAISLWRYRRWQERGFR